MRTLAERAQAMHQNPLFQRNREMQRDLDRLREHLNSMAAQIENTLQTMERMQKRFELHPSEGPPAAASPSDVSRRR